MGTETVDALILDLLDWLRRRERSYAETIEVWRTSCPKLPVWEDATDRKLVVVVAGEGGLVVRLTPAGLARLGRARRADPSRATTDAV